MCVGVLVCASYEIPFIVVDSILKVGLRDEGYWGAWALHGLTDACLGVQERAAPSSKPRAMRFYDAWRESVGFLLPKVY